MKRELGIARCGLACCLCSENTNCAGCNSGECPGKDWCENRKCSLEKGIGHCYVCDENCQKGLLTKIKPYAFNLFAKRYGEKQLLDCLEVKYSVTVKTGYNPFRLREDGIQVYTVPSMGALNWRLLFRYQSAEHQFRRYRCC